MATKTVELTQETTMDMSELVKLLEPMIRRVVREELAEFSEKEPERLYLKASSPLYESLLDIQQRKERGELQFHSYEDIFNE